MIVCGGDALTHRLALELIHLYREPVTLVIPSPESGHGPQLMALAERNPSVQVIEGRVPDEAALLAAGVADAAALALTMDDDQATIQAALLARSLNPRIRLVIRVFNRTLGHRVELLLDQAAQRLRSPDAPDEPADFDTRPAVLSASATAAPALVAAALPDTNQVIPIDGGLLTVAEQPAGERLPPGAVPLAVLPPRSVAPDAPPPALLPEQEEIDRAIAAGGARAVLGLRHAASHRFSRPRRQLPLGALFSRRLRIAALIFAALVVLLTLLTWLLVGDAPLRAFYLVLMDLADMSNPETGAPAARKVLQLVAAYAGMAITPLILALVLENLGALRTTARRPRRGTANHVVLIGVGKVGTRVLDRLTEMRVPVVVIERDPTARGLQLARAREVPVVIGDVSHPEVYERARIARSAAVMALTSNDSVNLEAVLYARDRKPDVRVVLRLFDDAFASAVYRTLRAANPQAHTRSRSVSYLAAPAFAAAMMGRQVLGAIPVERQVLLVAAVDVRERPELAGRTVAQAYRPGGWRVVAVDRTPREQRRPLSTAGSGDTLGRGVSVATPGIVWEPSPDLLLRDEDRAIVVATREGLGLLLQRQPAEAATGEAAEAGGTAPAVEPGTRITVAAGAASGAEGAAAVAAVAVAEPEPPRPDGSQGVDAGESPGTERSTAPAEAAAPAPPAAERARPSRFRRTRGATPGPLPAPAPAAAPAGASPDEADDDATVPLPSAPRPMPSAPYHRRSQPDAGAEGGLLDDETVRQLLRRLTPRGEPPAEEPEAAEPDERP
jgi:Trk K+ transport system NAD-binding subunit